MELNYEKKFTKAMKKKTFTKPDSIVTAKICTKSGKLARDGVCEFAQGGSTVRTEYFAKGTVPTEICDTHVKIRICKVSGLQAGEFCPEGDIHDKVFLVKEETGATKDTPYLLPKSLEDSVCNVHTSASTGDLETEPNPDDEYYDEEEEETDEEVIPPIPDVSIPTTPNPGTENSGEQTPSEGE